MNNTIVRVIVGAIGIPLIIVSAVMGNEVFLIFCTILSFFCMNEFYNLFERPSKPPSGLTRWFGGISFHKTVFLIISILIVISFYFEHFNYVLILYFFMFLFLIVSEVFKEEKHFEAVGTWLLSVVYISTPFGLLSLMDTTRMLDFYGANYAIICLVLVWVSDTFAFFGGKLFGRHKLAERISPKKTWEGSIIGFAFVLVSGVVIWKFFYPDFTVWHWLSVTLIVGFFAQIGDLFESNLKRSVKVKDSSNLIPGHGGALDRFDSILFAVPALYIFLYIKSIM
ncbi:MAG TPA: phosphatidate cytidylyltransferase [Ignavibacteria bacterium]|nr:phosphatidate cytidylyltransferase [Ignavibacteria bacterium]HRE11697.1 phosphatidate cytidylyltransferase [Ignavibacteria bacterium]HRF66040.1 phosphatidate cytidylyltransferase [Ignavibacteria bacterium]HRJ02880.1 phosphatidate cytidylyltransferase [Ignavibacteria bacterium]HRJ86414.1 phosphatidate cytidylyltransferase [Ignavibacteria bacterium]